MESIMKESHKVKGIEILYFEEAQIEKIKGSSRSFAAVGPLSVLYVKDYHRIVFQLNDWRYPLLRRLRVMSTSDKFDLVSQSYIMPALNGFSYQLTLTNVPNNEILSNFENILKNNCDFYHKSEDITLRKIEASPEHKLTRKSSKEVSITEMAMGTVNSIIQNIKTKLSMKKSGSKYLTSRKQKLNLDNIKNKNFRKNARSSFKKNFFSSHEKLTDEFLRLRKENKNLYEGKELDALMKTSESKAPVLFIDKDDLEDAILNNKDLANKGNYIRQSSSEILESIKKEVKTEGQEIIGGQRVPENQSKSETVTGLESISHYHG